MLVDSMTKDALYLWLLDLIQWEMPVSEFIAQHCDPDILIERFAAAFPECVSRDREYE